mmetsp:Transcript_16112/g.55021  ORF Transcript_16112/g.55021 Transcript_16112/m.55021 type:complete len:237 (-) Transcript_16112:8-718(-)
MTFTRVSLDHFWRRFRTKAGREVLHACFAGVAAPCRQSALALAYLLRPNARLRGLVGAHPKPPAPFLAMHVRHGDKGSERKGQAPLGLGAYVELARARFPGVRYVWLMTEDPAVIAETEDAAFEGLTFFYTRTTRTNAAERGLSPLQVWAVSLNSLLNLFISVEAHGFVGKDDSTWFRLVVMLAYGTHDRVPRVANLGGSAFWTKGGFGSCFRLPTSCLDGGRRGNCTKDKSLFFP